MDAQDALFDDPPAGRLSGPSAPSASEGPADATQAPALPPSDIPLAERLRPRHLDEVIGQAHLLGPGKPLRVAFEAGRLHSMILWGPPGVGKTTLARLVAGAVRARLIVLSAVLAGVKDIRDAVDQARAWRSSGMPTVVFVDEVHRFNKAQQDAFLPHVESGLFTFIGATTENPSFEVNSALLSRATVHVLQALDDDDLARLIERARQALAAPPLTEAARRRLIGFADGDARRLLNAYQNLISGLGDGGATAPAEIDEARLEQTLGALLRRYDKGGDHFYDQISALHKSVRGSSPDGALYWLCRMLDGGADPRYLARRIVRMAWEDIGLADPRAMQIANDAALTYERLGSPEGELALGQAVIYLAMAAKSNAGYLAFNAARAFVKQDGSREVPPHLRNAPTRLMKALGHGQDYRYAHDEPDAYAAGQTYLPDSVGQPGWYRTVPRGLEARIAEKMAALRRLDDEAAAG